MKEPDSFDAPKFNGDRFNTTHWSVVLLAGGAQSNQSREALETLCRTYWSPLYAFIRRRGYPQEDARDLTQEFFAFLLERNDLRTLDAQKGRFRTFLLTALTHFLANDFDRAHAAKRGGGQEILPLEELEAERSYLTPSCPELSPDRLFDQRWAITILERALAHLQREQAQAGKGDQFELFKGYLTEDPGEGEYAVMAKRLGIVSQTLAVRVHRLRQRFRELVRAEVAQTISSPFALQEEMQHLFQALSESA